MRRACEVHPQALDIKPPGLVECLVWEVMTIYAIIETGGKQYRVAQGQTVEVDRLKVEDGDTVEINRVLLIADGDRVVVGAPTVTGAKVLATSQGQEKGDKIAVFKYKSKVRYRRKTGHRAVYTRLVIDKIVEPEVAEVGA